MDPLAAADPSADYPDLARIAATVRRWWWLVLLGTLVGAALGVAGSQGAPTSYEARATLLVGPLGGDRFSALRAAEQQGQTYARLAMSVPVVSAARGKLTPQPSLGQLLSEVSASADEVTRLLTITARTARPDQAAATANALAAALKQATQSRSLDAVHQLTVVDPAEAPSLPVGGKARIFVVIAALAGLLGTLTVLVLLDLVRGRVATEKELAAASRAPVLGTARRGDGALVGAAGLLSPNRRIVVTGVEDDGTAAQVALSLATALAARGARVLLVDADGGREALTRRLRLEGKPGFAEILADPNAVRSSARIAELVVSHAPRVTVLPRGLGELAPNRVRGVLRRLDAKADLVVLSAPPAIGFPGAIRWTPFADGAVLAVRRGHATTDRIAIAVAMLEQSGAVVLGTVLAGGRLRGRPRRRRRRRRPASPPAAPVAAGEAGAA
ncbi:MAG: Wzz/FepE/Etk N-terminal domain-containing protein [Solirubrobacteraceae bacterium]